MPLSATILLLGVLVLLCAGCREKEPEPRFRIVPADSEEGRTLLGADDPNPEHGQEMSAASRRSGGATPPLEQQLPAALGDTFYVKSGRGEQQPDGSQARPWRSIEAALTALKPGDRLVVLPGAYRGPLLLAGPGSAEPIEIVGRADAVFRNADDANAPVITVDGGSWSLIGIEIQPGETSVAVMFTDTAQNSILRDAHIHSGGSDGVIIAGGARQILVEKTHLHHIGNADSAAIRVESGAAHFRLLDNKIHAVRGAEIWLFEQGLYDARAQGREGSRRLLIPESGIEISEGVWEP